MALGAAKVAAGKQHYPQGMLYVVATPIGNLADISLRALHVLQLVDCIACEDTRHTQGLLRQFGIDKTMLAVHEHNEQEAAVGVIDRLQRGERPWRAFGGCCAQCRLGRDAATRRKQCDDGFECGRYFR